MLNTEKIALQRLLQKLQQADLAAYQPPWRGTELNLLQRVPRGSVNLDFEKLEQKLQSAYDKLDDIEKYIYHKRCRQQYILTTIWCWNPLFS